ncbi:MAG TPA: hypothetical protein VJ506_00760 [Candidatus Limnocylindrales bacterium]|nr:hypothetical protein [Candidatus Limnocylindrales bacterium]
MIDPLLDGQLRDLLRHVPQVAPAVVDQAIEEARGVAQRRPRFARLDPRAWPPQARSIADPGVRRSARLILVLALVALLAVAVVGVGSRLLTDRPSLHASLTSAGALRTVVRAPRLTALANGRLLVIGQSGSRSYALLFDPATGASSGGGSFGPPFSGAPGAEGLPDGRVVVIGPLEDVAGNVGPSALGWLDISTGDVTVVARMHESRFAPANAFLPDGRVVIAGGMLAPGPQSQGESPVYLASVEVFDPRTAAFSGLPPLPQPRFRSSMVVLDDGTLLIAGGWGPTGQEALDVDVYDPTTGQSTVVGAIGPGRGIAAGPPLRLADGSVLIPGGPIRGAGCPNVDGPQAMYRFDPVTRQVTSLASMPHAGEQAVALADGRVLVFGVHGAVPGGCGSGAAPILAPWIGVYDPTSGVTVETTDPTTGTGSLEVTVARMYESGALLPDGRVALIADDSDNPVPNPVDLLRLTN